MINFSSVENMYNIDRREFERLLQRGVTHSQWLRIKATDKYLSELWLRVKSSQVTEIERKKVAAMIRQESQDIWDALFTGCVGEAVKYHPELSTQKRYEYAWNWAETLMLNELYAPPHFTKCGDCIHCGPVLLSEKAIHTEMLHACPWCAVPMLRATDFINEKTRRH